MRRVVYLVLVATSGCGLGLFEAHSGGAENLPSLGAGPFAKPSVDFDTPAEEPYIVSSNTASYFEPSVLSRDDGGFRVFFANHEDDSTVATIWLAETASVIELLDVQPMQVMAATESWEQGRVTAPSIIETTDGVLVMFYEGGVDVPAIGRADSSDGGLSWVKDAGNPVIVDGKGPGAAQLDDDYIVLFQRGLNILRADSVGPSEFQITEEPVLVPRYGVTDAFDSEALSSPNLTVTVSEAGQTVFGVHYVGQAKTGNLAIGYAGSFDGWNWQRFGGLDAVVDGSAPDELGPAVVVRGPRAFLFFSEARNLRQRIAVAVHP